MSATIFLRRLWKILLLTTSMRPPKCYVNFLSVLRLRLFGPKTASGPRRWASSAEMSPCDTPTAATLTPQHDASTGCSALMGTRPCDAVGAGERPGAAFGRSEFLHPSSPSLKGLEKLETGEIPPTSGRVLSPVVSSSSPVTGG